MSALRAWLITDPLIALATIFFATISMLVSLFDNAGRRQAAVARAWSRVLLAVSGVKVRVEGGEKISPDGSYVFASNHASYMDTPVVLANIPVQFRFMAKKGLFSIPFLGWHLGRAGHIPVFRDNPRAAVKTLGLAAEAIGGACSAGRWRASSRNAPASSWTLSNCSTRWRRLGSLAQAMAK